MDSLSIAVQDDHLELLNGARMHRNPFGLCISMFGVKLMIRGSTGVFTHVDTVGSRRIGCSNSHRFSSPEFPIFGCSLLLCVSFHC